MIFVRYEDMELCVRGFTKRDKDGNFNIYLNSRYCYSQLQKTLKHELDHIRKGDFDKAIPAHIIERPQ